MIKNAAIKKHAAVIRKVFRFIQTVCEKFRKVYSKNRECRRKADEKYYFDGLAWHIVSEKYRREYGIYKTARTLKAKRYDALRKMNNNLQAARV